MVSLSELACRRAPGAVSFSELRCRAARARIAEALALHRERVELGMIRLRPHQQLAIARVRAQIAAHGGCLLADQVGRGKTYVALAIARGWSCPLIVIPAALRTTWRTAMQRAECEHPMMTHEALSRGGRPSFVPDGIVVDESHHFRTSTTHRHAGLAAIAAQSRLLLLSATPVQNGTSDLSSQIALFLGSRAFQLSAAELARYVVRGVADGDAPLPEIASPRWIRPAVDDSCVLDAILALPSPPRPADGGDACILRTLNLVRAWASSRAALQASLARRRRIATAIEQCIECGRRPTIRDLRAWDGGGEQVIQLGFAQLLVEHGAASDEVEVLREQVALEREGLARVACAMRDGEDADRARVEVIRSIRLSHPDARVIAFSEHATTVRAYFSMMRVDPAVGLLTARESRVVSGRISRDELLARFAPVAQGRKKQPEHESISLLLATDLLSEGVNLQDAAVVVHLDLPWNPARLEQRVGRLRRPGGAAVVHSYLVSPPADTELLLHVEERLHRKLRQAIAVIGDSFPLVPSLTAHRRAAPSDETGVSSSAASYSALLATIARWRHGGGRNRRWTVLAFVAAVHADRPGWLAVFADGRLLGKLGDTPPDEIRSPTMIVGLMERAARRVMPAERTAALAAMYAHRASALAVEQCGALQSPLPFTHSLERSIGRLFATAPRHERAQLLPLVARLRSLAAQPLTLGAERQLESCLSASRDGRDASWLRQAIACLERGEAERGPCARRDQLVALILIGP